MTSIKRCIENDIPTLIELVRASYLAHYTHLWRDGGERYLAEALHPERLHREMATAGAEFYGIRVEGKMWGMLKLNVRHHWPTSDVESAVELERIYLHPQAKGKGLGRCLLHYAEQRARQLGKDAIWLKVVDSSPALGFYQKLGYRAIDQTQLDFELVHPAYQKMYILEKRLG